MKNRERENPEYLTAAPCREILGTEAYLIYHVLMDETTYDTKTCIVKYDLTSGTPEAEVIGMFDY